MADEYYQLTHTGEQIDDAINKIETLDDIIDKNNSTITDTIYNNKIKPLETTVQDFEGKIKTNTDNIGDYQRVIAGINAEITTLNNENNEREKEIIGIQGLLGNKVESEDYTADVKGLKDEDNRLNNKIEAVDKDLQLKITPIDNRSATNQNDISELKKQIKEINVNDINNSINSISQDLAIFKADTSSTLEELSQKDEGLENTCSSLNGEIEDIQKTLEAVPNTYTTQNEFDSFSEGIYGNNGIIANLQAQITALKKQIDELTSSN